MNQALALCVSLSLSGSVLILILMLLKKPLKNRVSKQWQYYIWLLVAARLLLPFAPEANLINSAFRAIDRIRIETTVSTAQQTAYSGSAPYTQPPPYSAGAAGRETAGQAAEQTPLPKEAGLVWLIIALALLLRKITVYQSFVRYIKVGQTPVTDIERLDLLARTGEEAGVKTAVELCVNPLVSSPLLIGFFRPCLVLPGLGVSEDQFRLIVLHELTHYRRRDMFFKWLVQITGCLHWFNPFVYYMNGEVNRACEFSCDEALITNLPSDKRRRYGETLLDAMMTVGRFKESIASVTLSENKELLKERLEAIMRYQKKSKAVLAMTAVLTVALGFGAVSVGAYTGVGKPSAFREYTGGFLLKSQSVQTVPKQPQGETVIFTLSGQGNSGIHTSSYFEAEDGQQLVLKAESSINGGTVEFFLFSPSNQEQHYTFEGHSTSITVPLSGGTWAFNCNGIFPSGKITITGILQGEQGQTVPELKVDAAGANEMALALTEKIWVWEWVEFFVPYMSEKGVGQILPTAEAAQWAGWKDSVTMQPLKFTQAQIDSARNAGHAKAHLTKNDIDAHAQLIMEHSGNWSLIESMLPYMTENGIRQAKIIYEGKTGRGTASGYGQDWNNNGQSQDDSTAGNSVDAQVLDIMQRTGNWSYVAPYLTMMSNSGIDAVVNCYNSKHFDPKEFKNASDYYN